MQILKIKTAWAVGELQENTYIIENENGCVVVDCGASLDKVRELTDKPIEAVILTHGHIDHIQYIEEYDSLNVPIYMNKLTMDFLQDSDKNASALFDKPQTFKIKNARFVDEGEITLLGTKVKCIFTPGHTIDGVCYLFSDGTLFSGDTLFSICVGRMDLISSSESDMIESLRKLKNVKFKLLCAGHGRPSSYEEQQTNIDKWIKELKK